MANQTVNDLLGAIERIGPLIAEHAAAAEADREFSGAVYQAMYDAGALPDARAESLWRP